MSSSHVELIPAVYTNIVEFYFGMVSLYILIQANCGIFKCAFFLRFYFVRLKIKRTDGFQQPHTSSLILHPLRHWDTRIILRGHENTSLHKVNKNIAATVCSDWCALHDVPDGARTGREGAALPAILWQHQPNCSHQAS